MALYLVTGGAGFIGSHLTEALLNRGEEVRVLDNFSTGKEENLFFISNLDLSPRRFTLLRGDIRDLPLCEQACEGVDFVLHQAALGSVPRSIDDPLTTNNVNIQGTLNLLLAARKAKVKRFIYASSSSVYGNPLAGHEHTAKKETQTPHPQSPYAITKVTGEYYSRIFFTLYSLPTVILRYFNVFGQRQDAHSPYAAVIPAFINSLLRNTPPVIYGNGEQSRDFTHVDNVVQANINACHAGENALGEIINIACGTQTTINQLYALLCNRMGKTVPPRYAAPRSGDVMHSFADISKAHDLLNYYPQCDVAAGLEKSLAWFIQHQATSSSEFQEKR